MSQLYYGDTPLSQMPASYPASRVTHESVSVTADGVKTWATLLNELYTLIDNSKVKYDSRVVINDGSRDRIYHSYLFTDSFISFMHHDITSSSPYMESTALIIRENSFIRRATPSSSSQIDSTILTSGSTITLYY